MKRAARQGRPYAHATTQLTSLALPLIVDVRNLAFAPVAALFAAPTASVARPCEWQHLNMPRANITQNQSESIAISPVHELIDRAQGDQDSCNHSQGSRDQATNLERSADMSPASPA